MQNKSERRKKLEQQRLFLNHKIREIGKYQDELMLRNILLDAHKEEMMLKSRILEQLIIRLTSDSDTMVQVVVGSFKMFSNPVTLYMN